MIQQDLHSHTSIRRKQDVNLSRFKKGRSGESSNATGEQEKDQQLTDINFERKQRKCLRVSTKIQTSVTRELRHTGRKGWPSRFSAFFHHEQVIQTADDHEYFRSGCDYDTLFHSTNRPFSPKSRRCCRATPRALLLTLLSTQAPYATGRMR